MVPAHAAARVAPSPVSIPTVSGPVTGGNGSPTLVGTSFDLGRFGYVAEEYLMEGTARAYTSSKPLSADGRWKVTPASTAPYTTRLIVYRPTDPKRFNGTAVVEWLNVTTGSDTSVEWVTTHNELIRDGFAWVGVSAQAVGVQGGASVLGVASGGLKAADPARYGTLMHPGDSYSYDIFSQAGAAVRRSRTPSPMGPLRVQRVLGLGQSQSASRLVTYIDAVQPLAHVYDGFLVHSRFGTGAPLSEDPLPTIAPLQPTRFRTDLDVPVLDLETETDLLAAPISGAVGYFPARQPDNPRLRVWEIAGSAHADAYTGRLGYTDVGDGRAEPVVLGTAAGLPGSPACGGQLVNSGMQYAIAMAAISWLDRWTRDRATPSHAPQLSITAGPPVMINRDANGNALGGIRTPVVDSPTATVRGDGAAPSSICRLFGSTVPFDASKLSSLYPTHADFVRKFDQATTRAVKAGFMLAPEAEKLRAAAAQLAIGT